jgi:arylformamidase
MHKKADKLFDISRPLNATTPAWPGDVHFSYRRSWTIESSGSVNVGTIETSIHNGTHCDAPYHFLESGNTIDQLPIEHFLGPCFVVDVRNSLDDWISRINLELLKDVPRVIFRTDAWSNSLLFPEQIPTITTNAARALCEAGLQLFGVDLPSVDSIDSKSLPNHKVFGDYDVAILEGLSLSSIQEGKYELIALPLRLEGADGSPVRAILRQQDESLHTLKT